ncbi:TIM barrel protein [Rhodobacterales bacterium LSUCC0387]|nr:TIM barrel protein [Rhodobacterales bacterium LSUCC0387]
MKIAQFEIGSGRTFVIAEIGNNHNGSLERAIELIDLALDAGADAVKFQMRHLDEVYRQRTLRKDGEDLGTEYVLDLLTRFELTVDEHRKLADYCRIKGALYLCTPWDSASVDVLETFGVPAYKVASADLTNLPLLDHLAKTKKPLILSTGMSAPQEVENTAAFLQKRNAQFALLHCNSTYPAPLHDINLRWMEQLHKIHSLIGYSGHERGINVTLASVALGAVIVERHFTLDRSMEGPDHAASLTYSEFKRLIEGIREIEGALGDGQGRVLSQGEMINRENLGKSLVAASALPKGTKLAPHHIKVRSPGQGLSPQKYDALLGRTLQRDMRDEDFFYPSDLTEVKVAPRAYHCSRPWGVPVRYHDFDEYVGMVKPDLWEFHLSYSDMDIDPHDFLEGTYEEHFVVHAPELFAGSRLMDLATPDEAYREDSLRETQRVIDITRSLKRFFPKTDKPLIVANIGGFTMDEPLPPDVVTSYYQRFAKSLSELDLDGVEIIPQTMAPFPWHFGGQRYQNLFVRIEEIVHWCEKLGLRMCFDVSHSALTSNHLGCDIYEFSEQIAPLTAHLHLGDAKGLNGEGLQIGDGDLDFARLGAILQKGCPTASFIPEIWQGHKNGGEGFWVAMERLERNI